MLGLWSRAAFGAAVSRFHLICRLLPSGRLHESLSSRGAGRAASDAATAIAHQVSALATLGTCRSDCRRLCRDCPGSAAAGVKRAGQSDSADPHRGTTPREHNLAKVGVEGSNPFARSNFPSGNQTVKSGPSGPFLLTQRLTVGDVSSR
jgi:hypothetical protein